MKGAVFKILSNESGLQDLVPYFSHFFYYQVKSNSKNIPLLFSIMRAIRSLHLNPYINLEIHLQQLLPAIFTCVVAAKLCNSPFEVCSYDYFYDSVTNMNAMFPIGSLVVT